MSDIMRKGADWLRKMRTKHMTEPVKYDFVTGESIELRATRARSGLTRSGQGDFQADVDAQEWIVLTDDLVKAGEPVLPQRGDVIRPADDRNYVVLNEGGGDVFRYCDSYRKSIRIFTKRRGV